MKKIILLVLVALLLTVAFTDARRRRRRVTGRVFKVKKCVEKQTVHCHYVRKCVKAGTKCVKSVTQSRCLRRKLKIRTVKKRVRACLRYRKNYARNGAKCLKCRLFGWRSLTLRKKFSVCAKHQRKIICRKWKRHCARTRAVKRCFVIDHPFKLRGPRRCRKGFYLAFKRRGRRITRRCVRGRRTTALKDCVSYLDPHSKGFPQRHFEFQTAGDFVMAETDDGVFAVHQRLKRFSPWWTGTTGMAVRVNGRDVFEYTGGDRYTLNGKPLSLKTGVSVQFPHGGSVVKRSQAGTQRVITVFSPNGGKALYVDYGPYANLFVYVPRDAKTHGYCSGHNIQKWMRITARGLFSHRYAIKYLNRAVKKRKFTRRQRRNAKVLCQGKGLKGVMLQECIHDVLLAGKKVIRILREVKAEEKMGFRARPARRR